MTVAARASGGSADGPRQIAHFHLGHLESQHHGDRNRSSPPGADAVGASGAVRGAPRHRSLSSCCCPIGLGLDRYVMTGDSMAGSIDRGSIAFERVVPVSDLRVGDVITYPQPGVPGERTMVTHRIVTVAAGGDPHPGRRGVDGPDPWLLHPEAPTMSRVEFTVPWIGWAYLLLFHPQGWVLMIASALTLVVLMGRRMRHPQATLRPGRPRGRGGADVTCGTVSSALETRRRWPYARSHGATGPGGGGRGGHRVPPRAHPGTRGL